MTQLLGAATRVIVHRDPLLRCQVALRGFLLLLPADTALNYPPPCRLRPLLYHPSLQLLLPAPPSGC